MATNNEDVREVPLNGEIVNKYCQQTFSLKENGLSMVEPYHQVFRRGYMKFHQEFQNFEIYDDDVWLCTFPKSGTRWMQELLWCLRNKMDLDKAKSVSVDQRVPYFELASIRPLEKFAEHHKRIAQTLQRPRTIKCHFSYDMLPKQIHEKKTKIVCVIRNPRDVCVSFLNHLKLVENYTGDLPTITELFLNDLGPAYNPYFTNVLSYWKRRHDPNIFIVFFEEMKKDVDDVIRRLAKFLEVTVTDDAVKQLAEHTSFNNMKANPMCNGMTFINMVKKLQDNKQPGEFMNKGKTGNWKHHFDEETIKRFEEWEKERLKDSDLSFVYEL